MKSHFELHIDGMVVRSDDYGKLKTMLGNHVSEYVIYHVFQSAMNTEIIHRKIITEVEIEKALLRIGQGIPQKEIAAKMHISPDTLRRSIRDYRIDNPVIEK